MTTAWKTAADLAEEMGKPLRWVKDHMVSGDIPNVKIGNVRFFTPECAAELDRRAIGKTDAAEDEGWSQVTRGSKAS